jgi:hypothetical protein
LKALLENCFKPSITFILVLPASLLTKEKSYKVFYQAFSAKGLCEKYISKKTILYKLFSDFEKDYLKSNFYLQYANENPRPFHLAFWEVVVFMKTCILLFC